MNPVRTRFVFVAAGLSAAVGCGTEAPTPPPAAPPAAVAPGAKGGAAGGFPDLATAAPGAGSSVDPKGPIAEPTEIGKPRKTASGLKYETLKAGEGPSARPGDAVTVLRVGTLSDGKVFEGSREAKEPLKFAIGDETFVLGWNEGVAGMTKGEVRRLVIPPNLGFGALGRLPAVPPNAELTYEIELLKIGKD